MSMDMDDGGVYMTQAAVQQPTNSATILCCNCGAPIDGTQSTNALCYDCIKSTVDISQGIPREAAVHYCRDCERWLLPPSSWVVALPESRELLAICLKKLRGLHKVRIIDAAFVWTEPHSRRIRMKLTVQDEVRSGVLLQQSFEVVYTVSTQQCPDCAKSYTANTWRAAVQVRQKVHHKRTFLYLEQLILKHGAHKDTINIKEVKDGIDFFFSTKNTADKFLDFLNSVVPVRSKRSQELISEDIHTSTKSFKFTTSVEIVPVCRDDLVVLPIKLAKQMGNISPLLLCHKIGTSVCLFDPTTLQTADISGNVYWRAPFRPLADMKEQVEFIVMDIDYTPVQKGRWQVAEVTVAKASDLGVNDKTYFTRTHLGRVLRPGDSVMGYMLTGTNFNSDEMDVMENSSTYSSIIPDVVLVRKRFQRHRRQRRRHWELKRMAKEESEMAPKKGDQQRLDEDYEMFLRDLEEDEEMRSAVALYKARKQQQQQQQEAQTDAMSVADTEDGEDDGEDDDDEGGLPAIRMEELLDDFEDLTMEG